MTINFQGGVLGSHKPFSGLPEALSYTVHQENSPIELENLRPIFLLQNYLFIDQISPEATGSSNQLITRPPGSLETKQKISVTNTKLSKNYNFTSIILDIPPIDLLETIQKSQEK
jgi:hypothetical protein